MNNRQLSHPFDEEDNDCDFQIKMATLQASSSGSGSFEDCDIDDYDEHGTIPRNSGTQSWMQEAQSSFRGTPYKDTPSKRDSHYAQQVMPSLEVLDLGSNQQNNRNQKFKRHRKCFMISIFISILVVWIISVTKSKQRKQNILTDMIQSLQHISKVEAFEDQYSPQSKALEWILFHDVIMQSHRKTANEYDEAFVQRYIIAVFGFAVLPETSYEEFHFFTKTHECSWNSQEPATVMGIICNGNDHKVDTIIFQSVGLAGELPLELAHLKGMTKLALDGNALVGNVPPLPNIQESLTLSHNQFTGRLWNDDDMLYLSEDIQKLVLSENAINGPIPPQFKYLTSLKHLALDGNKINGGINNLMGLYRLKKLQLQHNELQDRLSNGSFEELVHLKVLNLNNNRIEGPLPDALFTLPELVFVNFQTNNLNGRMLNIQPEGTTLKYLNIGENFLTGGIPESLNLLTELTHLDLSWNRFDAPLPTSEGFMESLTNLETLLLTDNDMLGPQPIPTFLQKLSNLKQLSLRATDRTGTIPDWFGATLTNLQLLDLDWNHLEGTIPINLSNMTSMQYLMLNRNWLLGTIPEELVSSMPNLEVLLLDKNRLVGTLDTCVSSTGDGSNKTSKIPFLITDCGDPDEGCPDCPESTTQEVDCPCCTHCCFDADDYCNTNDWLTEIILADEEGNQT